MELKLTSKELTVLELIKQDQNEPGHSDFLSTDAETKSVAGVVSSLEKKGLIYNSYANWTRQDFADLDHDRPFKMWCFTELAAKIVGKPICWK